MRTRFTCASVLALALSSTPSLAQDAGSNNPQSSRDSTGLQDIVVTAQRKSESLQRAAIAVTAISTEALTAKVTKGEDFASLVPSVVIGAGGGGTNLVAIRGIGTLASNGLTENVVAFNLDGVYLARPAAANALFYDLERVEVLKGPQGTLYGRNATAGAINIISKRPTFETEGNIDVQIGNYDLYQAQGALNLPLSQTVAVRIAGQGISRDGYMSDGYNDQKQYSGRMSLLAKPSTDISLLLTADYAHIGGKGITGVLSPFVDPNNPFLGPSEPLSQAPYANFPFIPGGLPQAQTDGFNDINLWGVSGNLDWDTGAGKLTVVGAYRRSDMDYKHYSAGFPVTVSGEYSNQRTLEVRYATPEENRLRAVIGGYYFKETGGFVLAFQTTPAPASVVDIDKYDTRSLAAFGQATFDITEKVRLIGGLRYSDEKKSVVGTANGGAAVLGSLQDSNVSWRAGLEADVSARSLFYATVATGFKAGGFYASLVPNTFKPEKLTAYTLGSKNRFLDNRLQFNLELYYWKYDDKQVSHLGPVRPAGFNLITENAGNATIYGAEMEASFLATPDDLFSTNVLFNHTKYDSFVYNQTIAVGPPSTTCAILPPTAGQPATTVNVDCSGNVLQQAPKWSVNVGYEHTFHLANDGKVVFAAQGQFRSSYWLGDEHLVGQQQGNYATADAQLTYHAPEDRWTVGAYIQNIGDKAVMTQSVAQPILGQPVVGLYPPRTYGVRAGLRF